MERVFKDTYKLELPLEIKVHPTFHVLLHKPSNQNTLWLDRKQVIRQPSDLVRGHLVHKVEGIFMCRKPKWRKIKTQRNTW